MALLFVDHLTVIDCAYLDLQRGLVGESWIVDLELEGDLDAQSMVLDFGEVKRRIKRAIDGGPDHTLLVPHSAPGISLDLNLQNQRIHLTADTARGPIVLDAPAVSVTLLNTDVVDAEAVASYCEQLIRQQIPATVTRIDLRLRHEEIDGAYYHYVHGLKKHDGACQRIAHGHRSRLEITVEGHRDRALEQTLADELNDIYLVSDEDITERSPTQLCTAYEAPEGHFALRLPSGTFAVVPQDSTVECLADWLLTRAQRIRPGQSIRIRAFEGVQKGAIATSPAKNK